MLTTEIENGGGRGAEFPLTAKNFPKIRKKRGKVGKRGKKLGKRGKLGRKGKNLEGSFTLRLLTERAGYATDLDYF